MVAAPKLRNKKCVFKPQVDGEDFPELLKVAAIYGPNASGKSTLLSAYEVLRRIAEIKPSSDPELLPVTPFRFDPELADKPSCFEYHFITNRLRYEFYLAVTADRIIEEKLSIYPKGRVSLLYHRKYSEESGESYKFGRSLEGGKELHKVWRRLTGPRTLFIAQAVANSDESLQQLRSLLTWIQKRQLVVDTSTLRGWAMAARTLVNRNKAMASEMSNFLSSVDIPITNIRFDPISPEASANSITKEEAEELDFASVDRDLKTILTHKTTLGAADFDFSEESAGTQNLIGFWLPWSTASHDIFEGKPILLIDEIDSSLHPEIVVDLIEKHLSRTIPSQLIFTTHDTHIMNQKILRRDQLWITDRAADGSTQLFSIHDFDGREGENVEKRYFEGRYRGLPLLRRG